MTRPPLSLGLLVLACGWAALAPARAVRADDVSPRELAERLKTGNAEAKLATIAKLEELGDLVYPGGGKEILERVRQVRAREKLTL